MHQVMSQKSALQTHHFFALIFSITLLVISSLALTGCFKSEAEKCIDKQSYLWDNSKNPAHQNKAYWDAVATCKEKYR